MTHRYDLLINSIHASDTFIVQMFLFAVLVVVAYASLGWTPAMMRRPSQWLYMAFALVMFVFTIAYSVK